jgi:hypothetical protein
LNRYVICLLPSEKNLTRYIPLSFQKCGVLHDFIFMISTISKNKSFNDGSMKNIEKEIQKRNNKETTG